MKNWIKGPLIAIAAASMVIGLNEYGKGKKKLDELNAKIQKVLLHLPDKETTVEVVSEPPEIIEIFDIMEKAVKEWRLGLGYSIKIQDFPVDKNSERFYRLYNALTTREIKYKTLLDLKGFVDMENSITSLKYNTKNGKLYIKVEQPNFDISNRRDIIDSIIKTELFNNDKYYEMMQKSVNKTVESIVKKYIIDKNLVEYVKKIFVEKTYKEYKSIIEKFSYKDPQTGTTFSNFDLKGIVVEFEGDEETYEYGGKTKDKINKKNNGQKYKKEQQGYRNRNHTKALNTRKKVQGHLTFKK